MEKFYVTTAIDYVNSYPHIGHSYQKIAADVIARWNKLKGKKVFFLTGTDEHGIKIARAAKEEGIKTKEFVDKYSKKFKQAWRKLNINEDRFIRTTDKDHEKLVKKFVELMNQKGDIYLSTYEGIYCPNCEAYITERDLVNQECPFHPGKKLDKIKEECYFFKLSKYQKKLLELYKTNPEYISPKNRKQEIINRVKEGLNDLAITRTSFEWGIPFPLNNKHIIYVWYEALLNYITGLGWPEDKKFKEFWPADIHLLGVDNAWFHCVIWPAMLMSVGIEPAKKVYIHGFLTVNKQKISKSIGNVIDPVYLVKQYGADPIRYTLLRENPFNQDGDFSEKALISRLNSELADSLGNLLNRAVVMCNKYFKLIPSGKEDKELTSKLNLKKIEKHIDNLEFHHALAEIWKYINECNRYINNKEPWNLAKNNKEKE